MTLYSNRFRLTTLLVGCLMLVPAPELVGQDLQVGIIDFHGLNRVSVAVVQQALTFKEGDILSPGVEGRAIVTALEDRLSKVPGVVGARINVVCCEQGRAMVYVGIQEEGAASLRFRPAPEGTMRLAKDIVQAGEEFTQALISAVQRGTAGEDDSQGHAISDDPAMRVVQERFLAYAARDLSHLRVVLRDSSDERHRALAAQVLGYVADKPAVVDDLLYAMSDPFDEARNNAMRTLLVFAAATPTAAQPAIRIPYDPFIALLASPVWSDLNKASVALMHLSKDRDPQLLDRLRREAIAPLVEMARWKSAGYGMAAFAILGRIAGHSEEAIQRAWERGERDAVINAVLAAQ